jgi:hypothetical protein
MRYDLMICPGTMASNAIAAMCESAFNIWFLRSILPAQLR